MNTVPDICLAWSMNNPASIRAFGAMCPYCQNRGATTDKTAPQTNVMICDSCKQQFCVPPVGGD